MKKRTISLFLAVSMSFTLFYPSLSLNDNVLECVSEDEMTEEIDEDELSMIRILRLPRSEKKYKLRLLEWLSEIGR